MAPRGLPAPVLRALHGAATTALRDPELVAALGAARHRGDTLDT